MNGPVIALVGLGFIGVLINDKKKENSSYPQLGTGVVASNYPPYGPVVDVPDHNTPSSNEQLDKKHPSADFYKKYERPDTHRQNQKESWQDQGSHFGNRPSLVNVYPPAKTEIFPNVGPGKKPINKMPAIWDNKQTKKNLMALEIDKINRYPLNMSKFNESNEKPDWNTDDYTKNLTLRLREQNLGVKAYNDGEGIENGANWLKRQNKPRENVTIKNDSWANDHKDKQTVNYTIPSEYKDRINFNNVDLKNEIRITKSQRNRHTANDHSISGINNNLKNHEDPLPKKLNL
jgi:hypothetical protein